METTDSEGDPFNLGQPFFAPHDIDPSALNEYRTNYQRFRLGESQGAHGEINSLLPHPTFGGGGHGNGDGGGDGDGSLHLPFSAAAAHAP